MVDIVQFSAKPTRFYAEFAAVETTLKTFCNLSSGLFYARICNICFGWVICRLLEWGGLRYRESGGLGWSRVGLNCK